MAVYQYTALDRSGNTISGTMTASGRSAVLDRIVIEGLHPVSVKEQRDRSRSAAPRGLLSKRVSQTAVDGFTRQLANLLTAGVSLSRALELLVREAAQPAARAQWSAIHEDVVGGMSLADSLKKWPRSFPPVYVAMVRAGETGGFLELVLNQIADFRSNERDLKSKVKAALVYPMVLAVFATAVLIFLLTYFIPRFSAMFTEFGGALPWLTRAIVALSDVVLNYGFVAVISAVLIVLAVKRVMASDAGRRSLDRLLLGTPAVGRIVAHFALVRFCRMLGTLLGAGVPLVLALRVAREAIGNQLLADTVTRAVEEVQRGASLARSLADSKQLFPVAVVEMVAVAEESGHLDKELVRVAGAYEAELDRRLRMLVALAEPVLLFVMAGVVGSIVIGMLLPVFTLQELIR